jgi:hypothetical protein
MTRAVLKKSLRAAKIFGVSSTDWMSDLQQHSPKAVYAARQERFEKEAQRLGRSSGLLSNLRLVLFLAFSGLLVAGLWNWDQPSRLLLGLSGGAFAGFVVLVIVHARVEARRREAAGLAAINAIAIARLERRYDALAESPRTAVDDSAGLGDDLDLFGFASLSHLLDTLHTPRGRALLAGWLLEPADPDTVAARQAAVGELGPLLDLRQRLDLAGAELEADAAQVDTFLRWAESEPWLIRKPWLVWMCRVLGGACMGGLAADLAGWIGPPLWLVPAVVNLLLTAVFLGRLGRSFAGLGHSDRSLPAYAGLFEAARRANYEDPSLRGLIERMGALGVSAPEQMLRLSSILGFVALRRSFIYLPVQALTLWDFHWLWRLERWKAKVGARVRDWLEALGAFEALAAFAALHHAHPEWAFAEMCAVDKGRVTAEALGHPLLPPAGRVDNDVELGPKGKVLLVTGSNMSGKSTLLRALGVNLVLAQAGAPVCARSFCCPPARLGTSFRVRDSLERGVSFFLAELNQLKTVVDLAAETGKAGERVPVYLFDEILLGTNVAERQVAVRRVLSHLLSVGAIGAIATHDLSLADAAGLAEACIPVHFSEKFVGAGDDAKMEFDYVLKPGVTPTTNALKLLDLVGLKKAEND